VSKRHRVTPVKRHALTRAHMHQHASLTRSVMRHVLRDLGKYGGTTERSTCTGSSRLLVDIAKGSHRNRPREHSLG
jgi:hypothetical protein